ncbi:ABC transporter permease [Limobrevibacterium gyesilva]|uniref:ABC transporter permease n=1 Tax=Limobrevibacterium gyesilva TaxID=2991712 RepID=A0AA42CDZ3_9PROT|nr:ABC transporter permease [Limobrevibacterium gyesilva]
MSGRITPGVALLLALLAAFVVAAVAAPILAPFDPLRQSLLLRLRPPGTTLAAGTFLLGTDDLGRDLLSRVLYGARASLAVAALSVSVSLLVGTLLGLLAGWFRGWPAILIMRLVDTMLSIPAILLAVLTVAVLGPGFLNLVLVLGLTRWPRYTRVAYAQTLQVANLPYIRAAEMAGSSALRILLRHVLPNIAGPLMVVATTEFGLMILFEAGLSFLGLGIQPPFPSWGSIMSAGRQYVARAWWLTVFPGACLFVLVLCVNLFGDWLRDRVDPRSQSR